MFIVLNSIKNKVILILSYSYSYIVRHGGPSHSGNFTKIRICIKVVMFGDMNVVTGKELTLDIVSNLDVVVTDACYTKTI